MAQFSEDEFAERLGAMTDRWHNGRLHDAIEAYFEVQLELRRESALDARNQAVWNARKADFSANMRALDKALDAAARRFERSRNARKFSREHLKALYRGNTTSAAITGIQAAVTRLVTDVVKTLDKYRSLIAPTRKLEPRVRAQVLSRFPAYARKMARSMADMLTDADRRDQAELLLASELRAAFEARIASTTPDPYERPAAQAYVERRLRLLELKRRARAAKQKVLAESASMLSELVALLSGNTVDAPKARVKEMLRIRVLQKVRVIPMEVAGEQEPPAEGSREARGLDLDIRTLMNNLEHQWKRGIKTSLTSPAQMPAPAKQKKRKRSRQSHRCGATCLTQSGICHRRTTADGYCYQHSKVVPDKDAQALAGTWLLSGRQSGIPRSGWRAELRLSKSGTARWKETQGANPGAVRRGRWNLRDGTFSLTYRAPRTGLVEWRAPKVRPSSTTMSGQYRTPQVRPAGADFGGPFSGRKRRA